MLEKNIYISFVVPVYNEEGNVAKLHKEILEVAKKIGKSFEIIFVDDGSWDKTIEVISQLKPLKIIRFRKNAGQTAALDAGFAEAKGKYVASLDGDLQNDPHSIPLMIKYLESNKLDLVCGWRKNRKDSVSKRFVSKGAKFLREIFIKDNIHDSGCTLRVYKKECFQGMRLRGEMHRFIPALLLWRGFKIGEMEVNHRQRNSGKSKYNFKRTIKGFLDMLTLWFFHKFASRPLHMLGSIGIFCTGIGVIIGIWMFIEKVILHKGIGDRLWPLIAVFLVLFGVQIFVSGLIMDLIIRSYNPKFYEIKEKIEN